MKIQKIFVFFFLVSLFFFSKFAFGQSSLTDFEFRAYQKGSQCIPYEKFRYWVIDLDKEKNEKKEIVTRKYDYDSLSKQKNNLIKEFNESEKYIKIKVKEIDDWKKESPLREILERDLASGCSSLGASSLVFLGGVPACCSESFFSTASTI